MIPLTVWAHDVHDFDVYVDPQLIPGAKEGDFAELFAPIENSAKVRREPSVKSFGSRSNSKSGKRSSYGSSYNRKYSFSGSQVSASTSEEGNSSKSGRSRPNLARAKKHNLYFMIKKPTKTQNAISVNSQVLQGLGISPRSTVHVRLLSEEHRKKAELDVVEVHFSGVYLTRYDHYQIAKTMQGKCISRGEKVSYLAESVRLSVENLFNGGKQKFSGYFGEDTRIVFRSDSARILIFVQMSKEMYNFDETGDIMFHQLVNSFIPEMLHQWHKQGDSHLVSIVLFTSIRVRNFHGGRRLHAGELEQNTLHFYRVVVDSVHISRWSDIMGALRSEFARFMAEVLIEPETNRLRGTFLPSSKSNLLEAFSLATTLLTNKFVDRDLCHTGTQAMVLTAGPACFDVDLSELWLLSRQLLGVEIGIELVCLARPPLHITPLFRARLAGQAALSTSSRLVFTVPTWINMSFWSSPGKFRKQWVPRCKIYDLQMVGILESEPRTLGLYSNHFEPNDLTPQFMKTYDSTIYKSVQAIENQKKVEAAAKAANLEDLRPAKLTIESPKPSVEVMGATADLKKPVAKASDSLGALLRPRSSRSSLLTPIMSNSSAVDTLRSTVSVSKGSSFENNSGSAIGKLNNLTSASTSSNSTPTKIQGNDVESNQSGDYNNNHFHHNKHHENYQNSSKSSMVPQRSTPIAVKHNKNTPVRARPSASPNKDRLVMPQNHKEDRGLSATHSYGGGGSGIKLGGSPNKLNGAISEKHTNTALSCDVPLPEYQHPEMWRVLPNSATIDHPSRLKAYGRWANVYPPNLEHNGVSWHSLKSPASLPLTNSGFPSLQSFQEHYQFQFYDIAVDDYENLPLPLLLDQMIGLRLQMGFQIAVGDRVTTVEKSLPRGNPHRVCTIVPTTTSDCVGIRVYLTRAGLVHRLAVDEPGTVNLRLYSWIDHSINRLKSPGPPTESIVKVKTRYDNSYQIINQKFLDPSTQNLNWSMLDLQVSGADDPLLYPSSANTQNLVSLRFVVLPSESSMMHGHETLSVEEGHVEGITRMVRSLLKHREAGSIDADFLPQYYTGKLKNAINEYISTKGSSLLESNRLNKQISLEDLAVEMQGPMGLEFKDRRWHWKQFSDVLLGHDLVVWFIKTFEDISSTEEAEAYGAELMKKGFLRHPENRHPFLHGHYFYEITPKYRNPEYASSEGNSPSSPTNLTLERIKPGKHTNSHSNHMKGTVHVSGSFVMNIDPRGISKKPERVKVSIDRTHNPKNAYHILLEWLNATPRLIDEYFSSLGRLITPYGLRLVQVPVSNVLNTLEDSPFRSALTLKVDIKFDDPEESRWFRHYLLRWNGYILDLQDKRDINTEEYEVLFMWGRLALSLPQYIHKSGFVLVQVAEDGTLKVTPNTLHLSRMVMSSSGAGNAEQDCEMYIEELKETCHNPEKLQRILKDGRSGVKVQSNTKTSRAETPTIIK